MFAIVELNKKQYRADLNCSFVVDKIEAEVGSSIAIGKILCISNQNGIIIKQENNQKMQVKILEHIRSDKKIIFKKRRRKHYRKMKKIRSHHTKLFFEEIVNA